MRQILTRNLYLGEAAELFGSKIQPERMAQIQGDLEADLGGIGAYADGLRAVETLQAEGIKIAIASNLASPHADPVRRMEPTSCEDGYIGRFDFARFAIPTLTSSRNHHHGCSRRSNFRRKFSSVTP